MNQTAWIVLEDGSCYEGYAFGAQASSYGEVVFNTSMTGYQEVLTDPSYAGQIVVLTYPMVGNYGISPENIESSKIQVRGLVVREECDAPSHWSSQGTLAGFLASQGIAGLAGVDTRAITRRLRTKGVMMGTITTDEPAAGQALLKDLPRYDTVDFVPQVSTPASYDWITDPQDPEAWCDIVALDYGLKFNIPRILRSLGCRVKVIPATTPAEEILQLDPDGLVLSPGPGDPALLGRIVETVKTLAGVKPIMGICLGHQILGKAFGGKTFKLKFGHRGANHPVRDLATGRVY
ncbi:MAG: glutamine-hydrolyzing carbamoyl-phosphate synthase small subunit, partial [Chloroflexi bacterium]|nr:glutamine-hydrolyzing carbamoyl-phosphate synthase small subunit [Chloroflexota bacterium]